MKKIIFMVTMVFCLSSCSDSFVEPDPITRHGELMEQHSESKTLVDKLMLYNDSIASKWPAADVSAASSKRNWRIALADAIGAVKYGRKGYKIGGAVGGPHGATAGAIIGAVVGGAAYSYGASKMTRGDNMLSMSKLRIAYSTMRSYLKNTNWHELLPKQIRLTLPEGCDSLQLAGVEHNLVLQNLNRSLVDHYPNMSNLDAVEKGIFTSKEFCNTLDRDVLRISLDLSKIIRFNEDELMINILDCYSDVVLNSCSTFYNINEVTDRYIREIAISGELEDYKKTDLYSGFCVMASSCEYWNSNSTE